MSKRKKKVRREDYEDRILELINKGLWYKNIAEDLNVSVSLVQTIRRDHNIMRGNAWKVSKETEDRIVELYLQGYGKRIISREVGVSNVVISRVTHERGIARKPKEKLPDEEIQKRLGDDWEYVGGYERFDSVITIRCPHCGKEKTVSRRTALYDGGLASCRCLKEAEKDAEKERRDVQTLLDFWARLQEEQKPREKPTVKKCAQCGKWFIVEGRKRKFCSLRCAERFHERSRDRRYRKQEGRDDISLERLTRRDGGVCWLCGEPVDESDCFYNRNGTFIAGDRYPSIDHVVPLSKGGRHKWENVRLAHRKCNLLKSDRLFK